MLCLCVRKIDIVKYILFAVLVLTLLLICGCSSEDHKGSEDAYRFVDSDGYEVVVESHERVVSLYGSFAETWILAGGEIKGVTQDAIEEGRIENTEEVQIIGTVKEPNLEEIFALDPDFVILSADIANQQSVGNALREAGIACAFFRVDTFSEYLSMLRLFCDMTGRDDLYEENGLAVQRQIDAVLEKIPSDEPAPTVLLLRAYSTGVKAKADDNLAGVILKDLGADNIASRHESLFENVTLEEIVAEDPDFIFVTTMGSSTEKALDALKSSLEDNPAWAGLSAIKNGRYIVLEKELFHYKPNARWGESYEVLAKILYPDAMGS